MTENLRVSVTGSIATVTIDRPDKRNALSFEMWSAFPGIAQDLAADERVRVVVVTGGAHFSAGADIGEFRTLRADADGARRYQSAVHDAGRALALLGKPTIAAVNGVCVGGGCEIALACDVRVAADDARFGITPAKLGIVFSLPSTKQLVDVVGPAWAKQILFTGEILDAATALRIGLVNEVLPAAEVPARALALAEVIASRSQVSVRGAKAIVTRITDGLTDEDDVVQALYHASVTSADYAEGVAAFLAKRPPVF